MAYRWQCDLHLDPATPGIAQLSDAMVARRATAIDIHAGTAREESSWIVTDVVTGGPTAGRRARITADMLWTDAAGLTVVTELQTQVLNFVSAALPYDPVVPDAPRSWARWHSCDHDTDDPTPCVATWEWTA